MGLHIHRAERTDLLADGLGALLSDPLDDPFAEEVVIVPAKGVERWLSQRLSHILGRGNGQDGVCAGIWSRKKLARRIELTVEPARTLSPAEQAGLEAEAERIGAFLDLNPVLSLA